MFYKCVYTIAIMLPARDWMLCNFLWIWALFTRWLNESSLSWFLLPHLWWKLAVFCGFFLLRLCNYLTGFMLGSRWGVLTVSHLSRPVPLKLSSTKLNPSGFLSYIFISPWVWQRLQYWFPELEVPLLPLEKLLGFVLETAPTESMAWF